LNGTQLVSGAQSDGVGSPQQSQVLATIASSWKVIEAIASTVAKIPDHGMMPEPARFPKLPGNTEAHFPQALDNRISDID
jgi:hypothetical protein